MCYAVRDTIKPGHGPENYINRKNKKTKKKTKKYNSLLRGDEEVHRLVGRHFRQSVRVQVLQKLQEHRVRHVLVTVASKRGRVVSDVGTYDNLKTLGRNHPYL